MYKQMSSNKVRINQATVEEVKVNEQGQVVIDIFDNDGEFYENVKVCGVGGNTVCWSNFPVRKNQNVTILKAGEYSYPICLGTTEKFFSDEELSALTPLKVGSDVIVNSNEDVVSNYTTDWSIVNNGNQLKVTENNGLVGHSAQMIRLQLMADALLRISKDGATVDSPLNGQQFIDTLFAYLDLLEAKVNANSAAIGAQAPIVGAVPAAAAQAAELARDTAINAGDAATAAAQEVIRQDEQDKADNIASTAADAQVALTTTSVTTKTSAEGNINQNILIP